MLRTLRLPLVGLSLALACAASLQAQELMRSTTDWNGGMLSYPEGQAEITAQILRLEPGQQVPFHCHPVPTLGYVLSGTIDVETIDGKRTRLERGDPAVEVLRTLHRGTAVDGPVEVLVFYAGAVDVPHTLRSDDADAATHCDLPAS